MDEYQSEFVENLAVIKHSEAFHTLVSSRYVNAYEREQLIEVEFTVDLDLAENVYERFDVRYMNMINIKFSDASSWQNHFYRW